MNQVKISKGFVVLFFCLICSLYSQNLSAQKDHFKTGIFMSTESIKNNTPDLTLEEVVIKEGKTKKRKRNFDWFGQAADRHEDYINCVNVKKISKLDSLGNQTTIQLDRVVAIAIDEGIYFHLNKLFVKAGVEGNICHIPLEKVETKKYMKRSQRYRDEKQPDKVKHKANQYVYKVKDGTLAPFSLKSIKELIADDQQLSDHFLDNEQKEQQLYLYLLKYNERNQLK